MKKLCYNNEVRKRTVCIEQSYFAHGEDPRALRLTSELVDLRAGHAKWIRRANAHRAASQRVCIITMHAVTP